MVRNMLCIYWNVRSPTLWIYDELETVEFDGDSLEIPMLNVKSQTLAKVVEYLNIYQQNKMEEIQKVFKINVEIN